MSEKFELKIGQTYYPPKEEIIVAEHQVKGPGWSVCREAEQYIFEFLASRHGGGTDRYFILEEEFEAVKSGDMTFDDLLKKYDIS